MSIEFIPIKFEASDKEKSNQKENNRFVGNCTLVAYPDQEEKEKFTSIFRNNIFLGYRSEKGKDYLKGLMECCINQLYDTSMSMSNSRKEYGSRETENGLDLEMVNTLRSISTTLVYISNSYSWREGKFKEFDAIEFKNKFRTIQAMCDFFERDS